MKLKLTLFAAVAAVPMLALAGDPVNENCPISDRPINPKLTITVGSDTVAFCCNGCAKGFKKWDEEKQLSFVAEQKASSKEASETKSIGVSAPYLLDTCPISGEKLGDMGDIVVKKIDGKLNPADMGTKHIDRASMERFLKMLNFHYRAGQSTLAKDIS